MLDTGWQPLKSQEQLTPEDDNRSGQNRNWVLSIMKRADEIASAADSSGLIEGMLDLMIDVSLADSANFFQLDPGTDELVITHVRGDMESQYLVGLRLNRRQGLPGIALCDTKMVVIGDLPSEPDWLHTVDPVRAATKRNVINLPVTIQEQTIGIIQIFNYQQAELDLLQILSNRLAVEIKHRTETVATRQANQRLLTLVDMLGEVAGTLDRNRLLHLVTENASRLVDAERSSVFLVDPNTNEVIYQVAYRSPEQTTEPPSLGIIDRQTPYHPSSQTYRRVQRANFETREFSYFNRSAITVPLKSDGPLTVEPTNAYKHLLGGLMVLNKQNSAFQEDDVQLMQILANQASTFLQVAEMYEGAGELFLGVIKALITAIDAKDPYTQGHSQRVSDYSVLISRELGLDEGVVNDLRIGSLLHDIGKIGISDSILLKNGKLTKEEIVLMKQHPSTGVNILSQVKLLEPMTPAIAEHHERLNGSGYPAKLIDKQISWMGRIVAVADVYDAMTSDRPYRQALSQQEVMTFLYEKAGELFDAECIQALDRILKRADHTDPINAFSE